MDAAPQPRRSPALGGIGLFLLVITALTVLAIVRYWHFRQRVKDTVVELRKTLGELRSRNLGFDDEVLDGFAHNIDRLEASHLPKMGRPVPLLAYIGPAPEASPGNGPVLTLYWLEAGQSTDGVVLEVASQTKGEQGAVEVAHLNGWANALSEAELHRLYKGRFERRAVVDVRIGEEQRTEASRDAIRITREQLASPLTVRLVYDSRTTDPVPVHVVPRVLAKYTVRGRK